MRLTIIVLAAGMGTRMRSAMPKVLHLLAGKPLIRYVLDAVMPLRPEKTILVLGHQADRVRGVVEGYDIEVVHQAEQRGTGHAVRQAVDIIASAPGPVMVLCADTPLLATDTLRSLADAHSRSGAAVTVMTAMPDDPTGYGRVVRGRSGVLRIVEEKDATTAQKKIGEVNTGIYCFEKKFLLSALGGIKNENAQGEYYLPDTIALARKRKTQGRCNPLPGPRRGHGNQLALRPEPGRRYHADQEERPVDDGRRYPDRPCDGLYQR